MQREILDRVIFSPGRLALDLAAGVAALGAEVTLFSPGPVDLAAGVRGVTADLSYFERELAGRGDSYLDLLKKHPLTFVTLARQVQSELIARAYDMANRGELDVVHVYANEEDTALPFAALCRRPVVFTHHDPFNFLVKYRNVFPKYAGLNWISMSLAQRRGMPAGTNWVGNIYHGLDAVAWRANFGPASGRVGASGEHAGASGSGDERYVVYLGRIIEPKGVHLAIAAVRAHNAAHPGERLVLKIAGKHYAGAGKDGYWRERIEPELDGREVRYVGFVRDVTAKQALLAGAAALLVPSTFEEPFGMVMIEALACGTPVVGLDCGAVPEVVRDGETGFVVRKATREVVDARSGRPERRVDNERTAAGLAEALGRVGGIDRRACRTDFEARFTLERMAAEHLAVYEGLA